MGIFDWFKAKEEKKLEQLLNGLSTEEGKAKAINWLVGRRRGKNVPLPLVEKAITFYEKQNSERERYSAICIAREAGLSTERLLELQQNLGYYEAAAELAEETCQQELANKLYELAIEQYEQKGELYWAANVAEMTGQDERAKLLYEGALNQCENDKEFYMAARIAKRLGYKDRAKTFNEQAIEQCERRGDFFMAAEAAEEAGQLERATLYRTLDEIIFPR